MHTFSRWASGYPIAAVWAAILVGCVSASIRSNPPPSLGQPEESSKQSHSAPDLENHRDQIVEAHNRIRSQQKLNKLSVSKKLQAVAQAHALDMAENRKMSHRGSRGSTLTDRIKVQSYRYRRVGENVATGRFTVERLMKGWMDSTPHKRNILGGFSQIGVGCAIDEDGKRYWCVNFGLPAGA